MGNHSHRPRGHRDLEHKAEQLLSARTAIEARELIALIREVNPTGRELPKRDEERRYALKSRLQSLLIARFADELSLEHDGPDENVVLLRHRYLDEHACHAAIDQLEPDARAWVRLRLDIGAAAPASPEAPAARSQRSRRSRSDERDDPIARGDRAVAEYDFDAARAAYVEGLEEPSYATRAARALLSLLVDQLAADADALALEPRLPDEALADSSVCELLAVAAARGGAPETARRLLQSLETPRAAEPLTLLAREALGRDDLDEAARLLDRARERDPLLPALISAAEELQKATAEARKPVEESASAAWERGAHEEAERLARSLLERWPDSAPARRIVRAIGESRTRERIRTLLEEAETATGEGRFEDAAARLRAAAAHGATGLEPRIEEADACARAARNEAEIARARELLDGSDREASLVEFLGLSPAIREGAAKLRPQRSRARGLIDWALGMHGAGVAELQAARAAFALEAVVNEGCPSEAQWVALEPHHSALERLADGRRKLEELRAWRMEQRQREGEKLLRAVEERFAQGELDAALEAFDGIALDLLEPERRAAAQELRRSVVKARQIRDALDDSTRFEAHGDLFDALEAVRSPALEDPALLRREREVRARLSLDFQLRVESVDIEAARLDARWHANLLAEPGCWISPDGLLYLARYEGCRLFITEVDLSSGRAVRQATLVVPRPLSVGEHWADERSLWFANLDAVLQLDRATFEPLRWKATDELVEPGEKVEVVLPIPGSDLVWICSRAGMAAQRAVVLEAGRWREVRRVDEQPGCKTLVHGEPPEVLMSGWGSTSMLAGARGTPLTTLPSTREWRVHAAAPHPTGGGLLVLLRLTNQIGPDPVGLAVLYPPLGLVTELIQLEGSEVEGIAALAASPAEMAFALFDSEDGRRLHAYRFEDGEPREAWRTFVPDDTALAQDAASDRTVLLSSVDGSLFVRELGQEPVALKGARRERRPAAIEPPFECGVPNPHAAQMEEHAARLRRVPREARLGFLADRRREWSEAPGALFQMMELARLALEPAEQLKTLAFAVNRHPSDPWLATSWAEELMLAPANRAEARVTLERLSRETLPDELVRHYLHLLGAARLHAGDKVGAAEAWKQGLNHPGSCGLESCLALVDDDPGSRTGTEGNRISVWAAAMDAIRVADARLAAGDAASALEALEASGADALDDVEVHARFAAAWLELEPGDPCRRFEKALALAAFVRLLDEHDAGSPGRVRARPMLHAWGSEKLAALGREARGWLERRLE